MNVIRQNVSIGVEYIYNNKIYNIDITLGKIINSSTIYNYDDHYIYSNKKNKIIKTNIKKHIELVQNSRFKNEIMIMKIWKNNHKLDVPSIAIEILVNNILNEKSSNSIYENIIYVLKYIEENIVDIKIIDPSNSNNIISDDMDYIDKIKIRNIATYCLSQGGFGVDKIVW